MCFQILLHLIVSFFVGIDNGIDVIFALGRQPFQMLHLPPAASNEHAVEFVTSGGANDIWARKHGKCARRQRSAFNKSAAI